MRDMNCCKRYNWMRNVQFLTLPVALCCAGAAHADHTAYHLCKTNIPGTVADRFTDNGNGTVTDKVTRLNWQRCDVSMTWQATGTCTNVLQGVLQGGHKDYTWKEALNEVVAFNQTEAVAGRHADWRLPNIKELATIANMNCAYLAIDETIFPEPQSSYWSSTPVVQVDVDAGLDKRQNGAWAFDFARAKEARLPLSDTATIRLVR